MTGTTDEQITVTMDEIREAAKRRHDRKPYVKVDDDLQEYLLGVLRRLALSTGASSAFAIMHTFMEISIEAGMEWERRRLHDAIRAATMEECSDPPRDRVVD